MLRQHLRIGLRSLLHNPGFALTAILTLALGIGLATAVFTVADALLLRKLPVRDQDRIVTLWGALPDRGFDNFPVPLEQARSFARESRSLERVALFDRHGAIPQLIRAGDQVSRLSRSLVSGDFFEVLDSRPILGRALRPGDDVIGAAPVMVLSFPAWQRRFAADSAIVGRKLVMHGNGVAYTVVGVMPQGLDYPRGTDFWTPVIPSGIPSNLLELDLLGRLALGATPADAREELTRWFSHPEFLTSGWSRNLHAVVNQLPALILGDTRPAVLVFTAASLLLLLIASVNVASILLVRGMARVREVAVRSALGAARVQIALQLLVENALLALAGGVIGVGVAAGALRLFLTVAPADLPRLDEIHLNVTALLAAIAITSIAALIFAFSPAVLASRTASLEALRSGTRPTASRHSRFVTEGLVAGQLALALLVLSGAGLVTRSLIELERTDLSLDPANLLVVDLALRYDRYNTTSKQLAMLEVLVPRLRALPGVLAVSPVVSVPFNPGWYGRPAAEGQTDDQAGAGPMMNMEVVGPEYFAALGVPVTHGRAFTDADRETSPAVVIVSEAAAKHFWPGADPVGRRLFMGSRDRGLTVVGVIPDTRFHDLREMRPSFFLPYQQAGFFPNAPTTVVIRTDGPTSNLVPVIRQAVGELDPGIAVASTAPFENYLDQPLAQPRLNALLLAVFGVAAVLIAGVGLFGSMATLVRQRTREMGVRMALGATARDVSGLVTTRALGITVVGTLLGLGGAAVGSRLLTTMLYSVSPGDPITLIAVSIMLLGVSAFAAYLPARRAARIDPIVALRTD